MFKETLCKKIEDKTSVDKDTIISLANKIQNNDLKDEKVLNELIDDLSKITKKQVSEEKRKKIIATITNDMVPKNIDEMI